MPRGRDHSSSRWSSCHSTHIAAVPPTARESDPSTPHWELLLAQRLVAPRPRAHRWFLVLRFPAGPSLAVQSRAGMSWVARLPAEPWSKGPSSGSRQRRPRPGSHVADRQVSRRARSQRQNRRDLHRTIGRRFPSQGPVPREPTRPGRRQKTARRSRSLLRDRWRWWCRQRRPRPLRHPRCWPRTQAARVP